MEEVVLVQALNVLMCATQLAPPATWEQITSRAAALSGLQLTSRLKATCPIMLFMFAAWEERC